MKPFKWRIVLPLANLAISIFLAVLGTRESQAFREAHPVASYEPNFVYIPPAQLVSNCVNVPAFVLSNLLGNSQAWKSVWERTDLSDTAFRGVNFAFYVLSFLFWCWIGWRIDIKGRHNHPTKVGSLVWGGSALSSLFLAYAGIQILALSHSADGVLGQRPLAVAMLVWGLGLCSYCCLKLLMLRQQRPSSS